MSAGRRYDRGFFSFNTVVTVLLPSLIATSLFITPLACGYATKSKQKRSPLGRPGPHVRPAAYVGRARPELWVCSLGKGFASPSAHPFPARTSRRVRLARWPLTPVTAQKNLKLPIPTETCFLGSGADKRSASVTTPDHGHGSRLACGLSVI